MYELLHNIHGHRAPANSGHGDSGYLSHDRPKGDLYLPDQVAKVLSEEGFASVRG